MPHHEPALLPFTAFADVAATSVRRSGRWRPGLAAKAGPTLHNEVFAASREAAGAASALALALDDWRNMTRSKEREAEDRRAILWVQTREAARLSGRPYRPGLPHDVATRLVHVMADKPEDALFALEEGLRCRDLAFVVGEISDNPRALDFTASRRLTLASEKHGVPLFLVRLDAQRDLSSARMRWEVTSSPSAPARWNAQAPGAPTWKAELFRARTHAPGEWLLHEEGGRLKARRERVAANDAEGRDWTAGLRRRRFPQGG